MKRLDQYLVEQGWAPTRTRAQDMVRAGGMERLVAGRWQTVRSPSLRSDQWRSEDLRWHEAPELRYVSRAGVKLAGALQAFSLDPSGQRILDVGVSTGGFADCLLQAGAAAVVGVDVGHNQIAKNLASNPRLTVFDGINARQMSADVRLAAERERGFDWITIDVSFISLRLVIPECVAFLRPKGKVLALVKPQFELGPAALNRRGIVRDREKLLPLREEMQKLFSDAGYIVLGFHISTLRGREGNEEFFILAERENGQDS